MAGACLVASTRSDAIEMDESRSRRWLAPAKRSRGKRNYGVKSQSYSPHPPTHCTRGRSTTLPARAVTVVRVLHDHILP